MERVCSWCERRIGRRCQLGRQEDDHELGFAYHLVIHGCGSRAHCSIVARLDYRNVQLDAIARLGFSRKRGAPHLAEN